MATRTIHVLISGHVQGVGYRAWCQARARALSLSGWVRNRRTGEVEAVFRGGAEQIEEMLQACRLGPALSRVVDVDVLPDDPGGAPDGFEVRGTV